MIEENAKKVKEMDEAALKALFADWDQSHQLDPFDTLIYGRTGKPTAIIRRIDGDCGILKPLTLHCGISVKEKLEGEPNIELLNFVDPDDGPLLTTAVYDGIIIYEIYAKSNVFIVFYDTYKNPEEIIKSFKNKQNIK